VLYIGTMTVSSALLALIAGVIGRDRRLRDTEAGPDHVHATGNTLTFLLALVITVVFPATSYWPLLLLILVDPVVDRLRTRRARAEA
jgi:TMEM175 potassium channel family protein